MKEILYAIAGTIIVAGVILYIIVPRIKPNPFLGFRVGYVYVSRRLWVKANRIASITLSLIALTSIILSPIIGETASLIVLVLGATITVITLTLYFERLAEKELISMPPITEEKTSTMIEPIYPSIYHIIPPIIALTLLVIGLILYYPMLPLEVAVHFNIEGLPDRYTSKTEALLIIVSSVITVYSLYSFIIFLGLKKPEAFHKPGLSIRTIRKIVGILYTILSVASTLVCLGMLDILYYNVNETHIPLINIIVVVFTLLILLHLVRLILVVKKEYRLVVRAWIWEKSVCEIK